MVEIVVIVGSLWLSIIVHDVVQSASERGGLGSLFNFVGGKGVDGLKGEEPVTAIRFVIVPFMVGVEVVCLFFHFLTMVVQGTRLYVSPRGGKALLKSSDVFVLGSDGLGCGSVSIGGAEVNRTCHCCDSMGFYVGVIVSVLQRQAKLQKYVLCSAPNPRRVS